MYIAREGTMKKLKESVVYLTYGSVVDGSCTDRDDDDDDDDDDDNDQDDSEKLRNTAQELSHSANNTVASTNSQSSLPVPTLGNMDDHGEVDSSSSCLETTIDNTPSNRERNSAAADLRLSMLSNFSTAYNVLSISLALHILSERNGDLSASDKSLCSSALFAGMIVGQLGGGALGDILGRHLAMTLVMLLQVFASFMSSLSSEVHFNILLDETISIFHVLAFWRFVLGLGCGGVYPLAATLTAESHNGSSSGTSAESEHAKGRRVAMAFSFQGVGYLVVPFVAYVLVCVLGESSNLAWRLLLGLGAVPGVVLTIIRVRNHVLHNTIPAPPDMNEFTTQAQRTPSILEAIRQESELTRKLLGTAGCWFLFDILFYGNTLFQPIVLESAFGKEDETVRKEARDSALIASLALPGYVMSVIMLGRQSPRYIQLQGFAVMALLYACIASFFDSMSDHHGLLLSVYGSTFFFSNYGPNATTFMLPSMTFSKRCRSTLNGFCAACGKVGALVGSMAFAGAVREYGQATVFWTCAVLSLVGLGVTVVCVNATALSDEEVVLKIIQQQEQQQQRQEGDHVHNKGSWRDRFRVPSVYSMPSIFDFHEEIPCSPERQIV